VPPQITASRSGVRLGPHRIPSVGHCLLMGGPRPNRLNGLPTNPAKTGQDGPSAGDRCQMTRSVAGNQPSQVLVRYWAPTSGDDWFVRGLPVGAAGRANSRLASLKTNRAS